MENVSAENVRWEGSEGSSGRPSTRKDRVQSVSAESLLCEGGEGSSGRPSTGTVTALPSMAIGWCLHRLIRRKNPQENFDALTVDGRVLCYGRLPNEGEKYMGC